MGGDGSHAGGGPCGRKGAMDETKKEETLGGFLFFYGKGWNYSARRVKRLKSTTVRSLSTDLR